MMDLTFIVPMYNAKNSILATLESLLAEMQSVNLVIQLLVIDDGSKDDSSGVVSEYFANKQKDLPRCQLTLIHQVNGGVSAARNHGLDLATGRYIWFVDADDQIVQGALTALEPFVLQDAGPDVVSFDYTTDVEFVIKRNPTTIRYDMELKDSYRAAIRRLGGSLWAWNAVLRREAITSLKFKKYPNGEDTLWGYEVLLRAKTIDRLDMPLYVYRENAGASGRWSERFLLSVMQVAKEVAVLLKNAPRADWHSDLMMRCVTGFTHNGAQAVTRKLGEAGYRVWREEARKIYLDGDMLSGWRRVLYWLGLVSFSPSLIELFFFKPVKWKGRFVAWRNGIRGQAG